MVKVTWLGGELSARGRIHRKETAAERGGEAVTCGGESGSEVGDESGDNEIATGAYVGR